MIIFNHKNISSRHSDAGLDSGSARGFTLVEIMVVVALFSLILASMIPTFIMFSKGMTALGNYSNMSMVSRNALEYLSRDMRAAEKLIDGEEYFVLIRLPWYLDHHVIRYTYDANQFIREQYEPDGATLMERKILFSNVSKLKISFYNILGTDVTETPAVEKQTKMIQLNATLIETVAEQKNTDHIISARFMMRNVKKQ